MIDEMSTQSKLSLKSKLMYGAGDFGPALTDNVIALLVAIFLTDVVGLEPYLAAAAVFIGRTWDYINDPIVGWLSDRTRTRWGRRRPYLLFGMLPYALTFALLWWRPPIESHIGLAIYYAVAYVLYDSCVTIVSMPYYALTPEITDDYDERTNITTIRFVFSIIGTMTAFILPMAVIGELNPASQGKIVMLCLGIASAFPLLLTFLGTKERQDYIDQPKPTLKESLKAAWNCIPFRYSVVAFLFTFCGLESMTGILIYFLKYRMNLEDAFETIAGLLFIVALISLPFWNWLSKKRDKRTTFIIGMVFMSGVVMLNLVVQPAWGLPAMLVIAVLAGFGFGCIQVLPWAIVPDVVEWDEYNSGQRHEGLFYSLVLLVRKAGVSLVVPFGLLVLQFTGYTANAPVQSAQVITGIVLLVSIFPAIFYILGAILVRKLPINRITFNKMREELVLRRENKLNARELQ
jgi:GPH family glycoside/pentoside/hexuronide:cation symporter